MKEEEEEEETAGTRNEGHQIEIENQFLILLSQLGVKMEEEEKAEEEVEGGSLKVCGFCREKELRSPIFDRELP